MSAMEAAPWLLIGLLVLMLALVLLFVHVTRPRDDDPREDHP